MALKWCTFILAILTMFTGQIILPYHIYSGLFSRGKFFANWPIPTFQGGRFRKLSRAF